MPLEDISRTGQGGGPGSWNDRRPVQYEQTMSPRGRFQKLLEGVSSESFDLPIFRQQRLFSLFDIYSSISAPKVLSRAVSSAYEGNLGVMCKQAKSFLDEGYFEKANMCFESFQKAKDEAKALGMPQRDIIVLSFDRAVVKIFRGDYQEGKTELEKIRKEIQEMDSRGDISESLRQELEVYYHVWLATCMIWAGEWEEADSMMRYPFGTFSEPLIIKINMTLALAHGHLVRYFQARKSLGKAGEYLNHIRSLYRAHTQQKEITTPEAKLQMEIEVTGSAIQYDTAMMDLLSGMYFEALNSASASHDTRKKHLGIDHFETLRAAVRKCWCLVYNDAYREAESLCLETRNMMREKFGQYHPWMLEATECLVCIFRLQARFTKAIEEGKSLVVLVQGHAPRLGGSHPLLHRSEYQLATAHLANGDYQEAERLLTNVVGNAEKHMRYNHPDILQYKTELARARLCCGNTTAARDLALQVAARQLGFHDPQQITEQQGVSGCSRTTIGNQVGSGSSLSEVLTMFKFHRERTTNFGVHPLMVANLRLLVEIQGANWIPTGPGEPTNETIEAVSILEDLRRLSGTTGTYNPMNAWAYVSSQSANMTAPLRKSAQAIAVEFETADLILKTSAMHFELVIARNNLERVVKDRKELLGEYHMDTLVARRALAFAIPICLQHLPNDFTDGHRKNLLLQSKQELESVVSSFEERYGIFHPETLQAKLCLLHISLLCSQYNPQYIREECEFLYHVLSRPQVTTERFVEADSMVSKVVRILETEHWPVAAEIARQWKDIHGGMSTNKQHEELDMLCSSAQSAIDWLATLEGNRGHQE